MEVPPSNVPKTVTARFALRMPGGTLQAEMTVPTGPTRVDCILPMAQALADNLIALTLDVVEAEGRTVSCRAGCGACCRQLVPLAEAEARRIRELVEAMPEPRRSHVRSRFAEALRRFAGVGLIETIRQTDILDDDRRRQVGLDYFRQHIAVANDRGGARTLDQRINVPQGKSRKIQSSKGMRVSPVRVAPHLPTDACQIDSELAAVIAAWPTLPEPVRAGIVAMVKASGPAVDESFATGRQATRDQN